MSAHAFVSSNGYHCDGCGQSYHCPLCEDGCGPQGHLARDAEGDFRTCQEPARTQRWREDLLAALARRANA